jgi:hypothetical protein
MKNQDSTEKLTEKDAKALIDSPTAAAKEADTTASTEKELTDEEFAAVTGGTLNFTKITI